MARIRDDGLMEAAALAFLGRIGDHDPVPDLRRVACPVLAVWGERDPLVPVARSVAAYHAALRGNPDVTLEVVPGRHEPTLRRIAAWTADRAGVPAVERTDR